MSDWSVGRLIDGRLEVRRVLRPSALGDVFEVLDVASGERFAALPLPAALADRAALGAARGELELSGDILRGPLPRGTPLERWMPAQPPAARRALAGALATVLDDAHAQGRFHLALTLDCVQVVDGAVAVDDLGLAQAAAAPPPDAATADRAAFARIAGLLCACPADEDAATCAGVLARIDARLQAQAVAPVAPQTRSLGARALDAVRGRARDRRTWLACAALVACAGALLVGSRGAAVWKRNAAEDAFTVAASRARVMEAAGDWQAVLQTLEPALFALSGTAHPEKESCAQRLEAARRALGLVRTGVAPRAQASSAAQAPEAPSVAAPAAAASENPYGDSY